MSSQPQQKSPIPRRSALYMPGANARALEKARMLDADCLLLDLEDAVAPDAKAQARNQICDALRAGGYGTREVVVRINGLDTPWGHHDLAALGELCENQDAAPDAILAPIAGFLVAAVGQPAIGLQQHGRAQIFVGIPPIART